MAKPRYSRIFLAVLFVSSCTYSPPNFRTVDLVVKQTVVVADDRQSAEFVISNPMKYDIICANPQIRVVFDNPRSYLDVGEYVASLSGLYVEAESKKELAISTREVYGGEQEVEVQYASSFSHGSRCRWASVRDFCSKTHPEFAQLRIPEAAKEEKCISFAARIEDGRLLKDVENSSDSFRTFLRRFFRYRGYLPDPR